MADQINTTNTPPQKDGGNGVAFIVGILVVVVAILAYFMLGGEAPVSDGGDVNVTIEGAADAVEGAVEGAASE